MGRTQAREIAAAAGTGRHWPVGWLQVAAVIFFALAFAGMSCKAKTTDPSGAAESAARGAEVGALKASPEMATNGPIINPDDIELKLLKHALVMVQTKYYDPKRIHWRKMVAKSFDALQTEIAEIVADFDRPVDEMPAKVELRVNTKSKSFDLSKVDSMSDAHDLATEAVRFVAGSLNEKKKARDLEYTVINGMLDTLDPHSVLLTPEVFEDMQTTHGGFGGLGIVIGIRDDELTVISPIQGTPASRAGLKAKDKITRIGQESTINMPLHEAVDRLRGEVGTDVEIEVMRKGWSESRTFTITRAKIEIRSLIAHAIEEEDIAYIRIKSFEENTGEDVREKLAGMKEKMGGIKGLILDLRGNAGGYLSQAVEVADTFLPADKTIVISEGVGGKAREAKKSTGDHTETDFPIVVLVDPGSASASEIVAGALKNHNRAVVVGDQTFGKGSVQILQENDDGSALKLTIQQYLTPGDISIQGVGIAPDIRVAPVYITEEEGVDMFVSENIRRENKLDLALTSEKVKKQDEPIALVRYLHDAEAAEARTGEKYEEDFEIRLAKRLIGIVDDELERKAALERSESLLERVRGEELEKITRELAKHDVDWTHAGEADDGESARSFDVELTIDGENALDEIQTVQAGETFELVGTVKNTGSAPIERLFAITHSNNPVLDDHELFFGRIAPGESKTWKLDVKVPRGMETRQDPVEIDFDDAARSLGRTEKLRVSIEGLELPKFAYTYQIDDTADGNGDGLLQVGEDVELLIMVRNVGEGDSATTLAFLKNESGGAMFLEKGRETLGAIETGHVGTARMKFKINSKPEEGEKLKFKLTVLDKDFGTRLSEEVAVPIFEAESSRWKTASGTATIKYDVPVYGGADKSMPPIARLRKGDVLIHGGTTADGKLERVEWQRDETKMFGWVEAEAVDTATSSTEEVASVELVTPRVAPAIEVDNAVLVSDRDKIELSGTISDDQEIRDYRVYLWHRDGAKVHAQKIDYGVAGRAKKKFAFDVPLRSGVNRVTIVARDSSELEHSKTVYISHP